MPELRFPGFAEPWKTVRLNEITEEIKRKKELIDENDEILTISSKKGFISQKERFNQIIAGKSLKKYTYLKKNEFSYNRGNSKTYPYGCIYRLKIDSALVPNVYRSFKIKKGEPLFFEQLFKSKKLDKELIKIITSTARMDGLLNISAKDFFNVKIAISTSSEEQQKIGIFLSALDKKIELMEKKLFYSELLKIYFLQNLIKNDNEKPKLRFPEFTDDWKTVKIGKIFDERVEKKYNDLELLSVTISNGVIKRSEIEDKDTSSSNKSNYKHVQKGDLVYNSMRMWQGASGISNYEGIVSPAYTVLIPKESINSKFYGYYFKKQEMLNEFQKYSQGLTSDTWNLKYPLISQIKVKKPPIEEQNKITELLNKLDQKIKNTKKYIERYKEFKRSLLSKMFC